MPCPMCNVTLSRQQEQSARIWACYNPECPVTMLIIDVQHSNSPWKEKVYNVDRLAD